MLFCGSHDPVAHPLRASVSAIPNVNFQVLKLFTIFFKLNCCVYEIYSSSSSLFSVPDGVLRRFLGVQMKREQRTSQNPLSKELKKVFPEAYQNSKIIYVKDTAFKLFSL